jgi:hypothetical protein
MHSPQLPFTPADRALAYLARKDALHKLQTPVPLIYGCPKHGCVSRRIRDAHERTAGLRQGWPLWACRVARALNF